MTDLGHILERLGLEQYLDALVAEGFDTWETVLDIQETDLDVLDVRLGHRRKLQREIANYRGIPYERLFGSPSFEGSAETGKGLEIIQTPTVSRDRGGPGGSDTKRKYRRHPKPDDNAPDRPPSAYVIFSNKVREDVKQENLSFTEIAKLVGDRWQKLAHAEKEPYEAQAIAAKERYNSLLAVYKKTDEYKEYSKYLADFKAKQGPGQSESKRPKLEQVSTQSSGGSASARSAETSELTVSLPGHVRVGSVGSVSSSSYSATLPSPGGHAPGLGTTIGNPPLFPPSTNRTMTSSPHISPPIGLYTSQQTVLGPMSNRSSVSDESTTIRSEQGDPLPGAAQLSLQAPTSTTSLGAYGPGESIVGSDHLRRLARSTYLPPQQEGASMLGPSLISARFPHGILPTYAPPGPGDEPWRSRPQEAPPRSHPDLARSFQSPLGPTSALAQSFGSVPFSSVVSAERLPELSQDQSQRRLPPPRLSPTIGSQRSLQGASLGSHNARMQSAVTATTGLDLPPPPATPQANPETDAITALAGLASTRGRGRNGSGRQPERGRPHR